ncbi:hypothetical protein [Caulobacter sp. RHG1]|uniref:hypothetical protein n=1 Tax=Caulobacter sp. (strain RHG1) TaxID=2545762 RepID=UPI001553DD44|nr:hypothetical protein [Caulobacter sp. RHG1]NQE62906.1 hypothetical protein [Caulobacter sp. RHG1]
MANYRHPGLIRLAAKAPHCMLCGVRNEGQVVSAHSNQGRDGKGTGLKASDAAIAFLCWTCHGRVDQGNEPKTVKFDLWDGAHRKTMRWLLESGHFIVSPVPTPPPVIETKPKAKIATRKVAWPQGREIQSRGFERPATPRKIQSRGFQKRPASPTPTHKEETRDG